MIEMRVAVQQKLDVLDREAELGDALFYDRRRFRKTAVQKNRAIGSPDEEGRDIGRADVVNVADDAEGFHGLVPLGALLGAALSEETGIQRQQEDDYWQA